VTYHKHVAKLPTAYTGQLQLEGSNGHVLRTVTDLLK